MCSIRLQTSYPKTKPALMIMVVACAAPNAVSNSRKRDFVMRLCVPYTGPTELCSERVDVVRERRDGVRSGLSDSVGRRVAHHDLLAAVHDRQVHGTPRIPEPRLQARHVGHEERALGVQSGGFP